LKGEFDLLGGIDAARKRARAGVLATGHDQRAHGADEFARHFGRARARGK